jgi:hypothetical protein
VPPIVFGTAATEMRATGAALTDTPLLLLLLALLLPLLPEKHMKQSTLTYLIYMLNCCLFMMSVA